MRHTNPSLDTIIYRFSVGALLTEYEMENQLADSMPILTNKNLQVLTQYQTKPKGNLHANFLYAA